jgi:serine protease Do
MKVWREGKAQALTVKVGELKPEKVAAAAGAAETGDKLGLSVQDLTPAQRAQLDVKGGVVVGAAKGPAARAGIQPGDVVLAINGEQVESATQFAALIDKAPQGRPLALLIQRGDNRLYVPVTAS